MESSNQQPTKFQPFYHCWLICKFIASRVKCPTQEKIYNTGTHCLSEDKKAIGKRLHIPRSPHRKTATTTIQCPRDNSYTSQHLGFRQFYTRKAELEHQSKSCMSRPVSHNSTPKSNSQGLSGSLGRNAEFNSVMSLCGTSFLCACWPHRSPEFSFQTYYMCTFITSQ